MPDSKDKKNRREMWMSKDKKVVPRTADAQRDEILFTWLLHEYKNRTVYGWCRVICALQTWQTGTGTIVVVVYTSFSVVQI